MEKTYEKYKQMIEEDGSNLVFVPCSMQTPEIVLMAVKDYAWALMCIPEDLQTPELVWIAVENEPLALGYVREDLQTPELIELSKRV